MGTLKIRKTFMIVLCLALLLTSFSTTASASTSNEYTEKELDIILSKAGYPNLDRLDYMTKLYIVEYSGEDLIYAGSSEVQKYRYDEENNLKKIVSGEFQLNTIPDEDLDLWFDAFIVYVNGVKHVDVYPNFEWKDYALIDNDQMAVAIPQGWQIISNKDSCRTYWEFRDSGWVDESDCGGRPAKESTYGYSWGSLSDDTIVPLRYKGIAAFRAKKISNNANVRFVGEYAHDTTENRTTTYSVGLSYGIVNFSISGGGGTSGGIDTAGFSYDLDFWDDY
ncbi:hypothetical protein ACFPXP_08135 [Marinicrinis lubricantis]|uniref:Uncharacterized protein n=1 Tax=Marinicrinis lubricantis TaxID=2086470 RepID=A0ABW1IMV4_9BACL